VRKATKDHEAGTGGGLGVYAAGHHARMTEPTDRAGQLGDERLESLPSGNAPVTPSTDASARQKAVPRSRTGSVWVAITATVILLLFLVIFIAQNGQKVEVNFLGFSGTVSLAVAVLAATVAGGILTVLVGTARIVQLRLIARRNRDMEPPR
jgi:lipopolysaccharide assembly protein A